MMSSVRSRRRPEPLTTRCSQWPLNGHRILITEDKDFGELVFVRRLRRPCIICFTEMTVAEKVTAMRHLIDEYAEAMREGSMIVVTRRRVRVRPGGSEQA